MSKGFLSQLQWRHATKAFDPSEKISNDEIASVLEAIRMAPTSFGLQPFYVKAVQNPDLREKMRAAGWNQNQFTTSTVVLVFVADTNVAAKWEKQLELRSAGDASLREKLKDFDGIVQGWLNAMTPDKMKVWVQKQIYIALGFAMAAAAELAIDSCPIEGFIPETFDQILELPAGHYSTVVLALGKRHPDFKPFPKWRFPMEDLVQKV